MFIAEFRLSQFGTIVMLLMAVEPNSSIGGPSHMG
jgi:hypothetical protein